MICFHPHALHGAPRCLPRIGLPAMIRLLPKSVSSPRAWIHVSVTLLSPPSHAYINTNSSTVSTVSSIQQVPVAVKKPTDHSHFGSKSEYESNKQQEVCAISLSRTLSRSNTCSHSCRFRNQLARAWNTPANWSRTTWRVSMRTSGRSSVSKGHKDAAAYTHKK